ncbi:MAG: pesticidal protein Cry22Aa [Anaerolineales bacterium]|nr:pesticidal protein Cry22Aa [Anaerolineales bacterium]MCB0008880.1 pesticidal protein Cry22Aa [Anaerolineales bacterium]MCB0012359.1 pesticidal protein Cry22Aa [Anaerolineales bacterium]MCB0017558.1 pesticidal protein Cry22Aa [Anaerolineales bacterium]MCB0030161.1 pesticidal protein Cry22Aa [Anaerolineales bacterium]
MSIGIWFVVGLTALALTGGLALIRLWLGPSLPDRVVASDLLATVVIAIIAVYGLATGQAALLDAALVVALLSFLGTVAFAHFIDRRS